MTATLELGPKGAITLPKKMREKFDLRDRCLISLEETPEGILIRPAVAFPIELYSEERLQEFQQENNASIAEFFAK
jgi:AbrB family looped-hinge helix DNA binding protein